MLDRGTIIAQGLPVNGRGLEIAPLHKPVFSKATHNILYTDYVHADELRKKAKDNPHFRPEAVAELDFVWEPGRELKDCVPPGISFDYVIASHVIEHVPNLIGWVQQVLDVMPVGGIFALVVPSKDATFDAYRAPTSAADLIDAWIRDISIPSPRQVFDCLSHAAEDAEAPVGERAFETGVPFEKAPRRYSDKEALGFACDTWRNNTYIDLHCSAFTPPSFVQVMNQLVTLGLLNVTLSEPIEQWAEFYVNLTKRGEPEIRKPPESWQTIRMRQLEGDLAHARQAFVDAVAVQQRLIAEAQDKEKTLTELTGRLAEKHEKLAV